MVNHCLAIPVLYSRLTFLLCIGLFVCFCIISFTRNQESPQSFVNEYNSLTSSEVRVFERVKSEGIKFFVENKAAIISIWLKSGKLSYDDSILVEYVRQNYLTPPIKSEAYNLSSNIENPSEGQIQTLWPILQNITNGFFIDCGANDGEFLSNSLWLEKVQGWNGVLIEADPEVFVNLKSKHRKVWHSKLCLSPDKIPKLSSFYRKREGNGGQNGLKKRPYWGVTIETKVQCIPLYTILLALNVTVVDFFSLDIEGMELEILKTFPFDKIFIKTLAIEHVSIPEGPEGLEKFMVQNGYISYAKNDKRYTAGDSLFVHSSLLPNKDSNIL